MEKGRDKVKQGVEEAARVTGEYRRLLSQIIKEERSKGKEVGQQVYS